MVVMMVVVVWSRSVIRFQHVDKNGRAERGEEEEEGEGGGGGNTKAST